MSMLVESSPQSLTRQVLQHRLQGRVVGVVPTMGALHEGHTSLVEAARAECDIVVVTIFVNPTQFGPNEDFEKYPRTLEADLNKCRDAGTDIVFTPSAGDMYSEGSTTSVTVGGITRVLEGKSRPGHFDGVTTIVAKLLHVTVPDKAYFGQKDYQQQLVIRRMVNDLNFPVSIVTCPVVRESDGLAMSSRNRYLSPDERTTAVSISQVLTDARQHASERGSSPGDISALMQSRLRNTAGVELEYAVVADCNTLEPLQHRADTAVALIAARVGTTRLIDNTILQFR